MDRRDLIENLKGHLTCSICLGYFTDPVTGKCGHSFCTECLLQCRERTTETLTCPECRGVMTYSDLVPNRHLQNLSIIGKMLRPHLVQSMVGLTTCDQHGEQEKFFCEEDRRLLCDYCLSAPEHKDHQVLPLETVANKCKDELQETQTVLAIKEKEFETILDQSRRSKACCQENEYTLKHLAISEYGKIQNFLWDEEYKYLARIHQESRDGLIKMKENMDKLTQQIQNLQQLKLEVEKNLDKEPLEMLQNMKGILERNGELLLQEPEIVSPFLDTCSITCLREVLLRFQREITLDAESANPHLTLSEDLKRVQYGSVHQDLPDNKDRNDCVLAVLGCQNFTSGKHYWEVEVEDKTQWKLGICKDSVRKNGKLSSSEHVMTLASFPYGNSFFLLNSQNGFLSKQPVLKVGVFLDYENGYIAFYDVRDRSLIHILSNITFEGPLCPYFSFVILNEERTPGSLIICPICDQ